MNVWALVWFGLMVLFLIIEGETIAMVSLWFAIGSLAALLLSLFYLPPVLQIVVFFLVSGILLSLLRPMVRKHLAPKLVATNVEANIGKMATVTADIDNVASVGQIKLGGMEWSARSTDGAPIAAGTVVKVDRIEGVRAFVSVASEAVNTN